MLREQFRELTPGTKIVTVEENKNHILTKKVVLSKKYDKLFNKQMKSLFGSDDEDADFTIICGDKKIKCHSIILRKFEYFKNVKGNEYNISKDVKNSDFLEGLLQYIYKGKLSEPQPGTEIGMYLAAKKIGLHECASMIRAWMGTYLNVIDACKLLEVTLQKGHVHLYEILVKIIEKHSNAVFKTDLYLHWSKKNFSHFLEHSDFQISEYELFEIVLKWCKEQAKRNNKTVKEYFQKMEDYIRYPLISVENFVSKIEPLNLVDEDLVFETYKYYSLSDSDRELYFKDNPRCKPRGQIVLKFKFNKNKIGSYVTIVDEGCKAQLTNSSSRTIMADTIISKPGIYYWEFKLERGPTTSYSMFGSCDPSNPQMNGYMGNNHKGFAIYSCNGYKYNSSSSQPYYKKMNQYPFKVGVVLNILKSPGKMYFLVNDHPCGLAHSNVTLPTVPACTLTNSQEIVTLPKNPKFPKKYK